jgi:nitrate reductase beta subunit
MYDMYRLLAIAKYDERYVIPPAHAEQAHSLEELATECAVSEYGGGNPGIFGEGSGALTPIAIENFKMLQDRQTSDTIVSPSDKAGRVNLLNWDGKGTGSGLFPPRPDGPEPVDTVTAPDTRGDGATGPGGTGGLTGGADHR